MSPVTPEQMTAIQTEVDQHIKQSSPIRWETLPLAAAKAAGAMMLFGEKYPDPVRMVSIGDYSKELCGGTHLDNTGQIERFEILSEEGVSAGTRRMVAITGIKAVEHAQNTLAELQSVATALGVSPQDALAGTEYLLECNRDLKKQLSGGSSKQDATAPTAGSGDAAGMSYHEAKVLLRRVAQALNTPIFECGSRVTSLLEEKKKLTAQLAQLEQAGDVSADSLMEVPKKLTGRRSSSPRYRVAIPICCGN